MVGASFKVFSIISRWGLLTLPIIASGHFSNFPLMSEESLAMNLEQSTYL